MMALVAWNLCSLASRKADIVRAMIVCCQYHVRERPFLYSSTRSPINPADVRDGIDSSSNAVAKAGGSVGFTLCLVRLTNAPPHFDEGAFRLTHLTNPVCRHPENAVSLDLHAPLSIRLGGMTPNHDPLVIQESRRPLRALQLYSTPHYTYPAAMRGA
jgi:hypothetical protein